MRFIDLFAGAGGLSEGFVRAGFTPVAHVEMDRAACNTLRTRIAYHHLKTSKSRSLYAAYLRGDIDRTHLYASVPAHLLASVINETIDDKSINRIFKSIDRLNKGEEVDAIVGGPPCQAYSVVGRARDANSMRNDKRNYLYKYYGRFLKRYQPKVFVFENVLGLESAEGGKYLRDMKIDFERIGYILEHDILNARDFGVLQNRKRILIIGWRKDLGIEGMPVFETRDWSYRVEQLLSDLPAIAAGQGTIKGGRYAQPTTEYLKKSAIRNGLDVVTLHCARPQTEQDKTIYKFAVDRWNNGKERLRYTDLPGSLQTHNNTSSFLDRFKVVAANEQYAHTVVAHINRDGHHYIHPDIDQNRSITVREAARLQSFPDNYFFEGIKESNPRTAAFKQIGNAVPPLMAESIARAVRARI